MFLHLLVRDPHELEDRKLENVQLKNEKNGTKKFVKTKHIIGEGGTSTLFLSFLHEAGSTKLVALKCYSKKMKAQISRIRDESEFLESVLHKNVVCIYFWGFPSPSIGDFVCCQALEYVEGQTLEKYMQETLFGENKIQEIFSQVVNVLSFFEGERIDRGTQRPQARKYVIEFIFFLPI